MPSFFSIATPMCVNLSLAGLREVEQFEMHLVAAFFVKQVAKIVPAVGIAQGADVEHAS